MLTRGHDEADYRLLLGHVEPGSHKVELVTDSSKSAHDKPFGAYHRLSLRGQSARDISGYQNQDSEE